MDDDVDEILASVWPADPDRGTVDRIAGTVAGRLARRRRRLRTVRLGAALCACALGAGILLFIAAVTSRPGEEGGSVAKAPSPSGVRGAPEAVEVRPEVGAEVQPEARPVVRPVVRPGRGHGGPSLLADSDDTQVAKPYPRERRDTARPFWERCALLSTAAVADNPASRLAAFLDAELAAMDEASYARAMWELETALRRDRRLPGDAEVLLSAIAASDPPRAWPILERILRALGPDPGAIRAAGRLADPRAAPLISRWLFLGDERSEAAAWALGCIPGTDSLVALLEAAETFRTGARLFSRETAREVAVALAGREEEVCAYLFAAPPGRRAIVCRALCELGTPAARDALRRAGESPLLRELALRHLPRMETPESSGAPVWAQMDHRETLPGKETSS